MSQPKRQLKQDIKNIDITVAYPLTIYFYHALLLILSNGVFILYPLARYRKSITAIGSRVKIRNLLKTNDRERELIICFLE